MARILVEQKRGGFLKRFVDATDEPAPTILTIVPDYKIDPDDDREEPPDDRPPYRIPAMAEIREVEPNGLKVVSTFAGAGGSSTGYRMAGFTVAWANDFIPAAGDSYRANMGEGTIFDGGDVRKIEAEAILDATGLAPGELDVFDGSPPCQAFSTAGKIQKGWGKNRAYENGAAQKNEELFFEYIRLLQGLQPKVCVAENVSGLVKGAAKGFFLEILAGLKACGYRVEARTLDAQWLGVPQRRKRVIFMGVREDLGLAPAFPKPLPYRYLLRDALPWIRKAVFDSGGTYNGNNIEFAGAPSITITSQSADHITVEAETDISRYAIGDEWDRIGYGGRGLGKGKKFFSLERPHPDEPSPTITAMVGAVSAASVVHPTEKRKFSVGELKRICSFPDDFALMGSFAQQCEQIGNAVPPVMMSHVAATIRDRILQA